MRSTGMCCRTVRILFTRNDPRASFHPGLLSSYIQVTADQVPKVST